jgi:hypothetical protein
MQKRKITGDTATKLEDREQAYAEQGCGPEGSEQATAMQARLAAAWNYHKQSCAQAGKAEPMVKAWKKNHASTKVSKATPGGTGAGNTAGEAVTMEQKSSPPLQREGKPMNPSNPGGDSPDNISTENSGDESSSGRDRDEKRSQPSRKLWRCTGRMKPSGHGSRGPKKKSPLCNAGNAASRKRCKQCHAMNPDLMAGRGQDEVTEDSSDASSSEAQFGANGNSSGDSAALVEATNEAHLRYAKLPVDHWVHPWSLSAIKARTSYALEVALTPRELCSMPKGRTEQQTVDLQVQFHHHWQAIKWGSTRSTAAVSATRRKCMSRTTKHMKTTSSYWLA